MRLMLPRELKFQKTKLKLKMEKQIYEQYAYKSEKRYHHFILIFVIL